MMSLQSHLSTSPLLSASHKTNFSIVFQRNKEIIRYSYAEVTMLLSKSLTALFEILPQSTFCHQSSMQIVKVFER